MQLDFSFFPLTHHVSYFISAFHCCLQVIITFQKYLIWGKIAVFWKLYYNCGAITFCLIDINLFFFFLKEFLLNNLIKHKIHFYNTFSFYVNPPTQEQSPPVAPIHILIEKQKKKRKKKKKKKTLIYMF